MLCPAGAVRQSIITATCCALHASATSSTSIMLFKPHAVLELNRPYAVFCRYGYGSPVVVQRSGDGGFGGVLLFLLAAGALVWFLQNTVGGNGLSAGVPRLIPSHGEMEVRLQLREHTLLSACTSPETCLPLGFLDGPH